MSLLSGPWVYDPQVVYISNEKIAAVKCWMYEGFYSVWRDYILTHWWHANVKTYLKTSPINCSFNGWNLWFLKKILVSLPLHGAMEFGQSLVATNRTGGKAIMQSWWPAQLLILWLKSCRVHQEIDCQQNDFTRSHLSIMTVTLNYHLATHYFCR